jgi:hypothetical protein
MNVKHLFALSLCLAAAGATSVMASNSEIQGAQTLDRDVLYDVSFIGNLKAASEKDGIPVFDQKILNVGHPGTLSLTKTRVIFAYKSGEYLVGPFLGIENSDGHEYHAKFFRHCTVLGIQSHNGEAYYFYHEAGFSKKDRDLIFDAFPEPTTMP